MAKRRKKNCPLLTHYAGAGRSCIGCGKIFLATPSKTPAKTRKTNPPAAGAKRIGRVRKIWYDRDQGNRQGAYYHIFTRRAAGLWTEPSGKVSIR